VVSVCLAALPSDHVTSLALLSRMYILDCQGIDGVQTFTPSIRYELRCISEGTKGSGIPLYNMHHYGVYDSFAFVIQRPNLCVHFHRCGTSSFLSAVSATWRPVGDMRAQEWMIHGYSKIAWRGKVYWN
jgi:hypothetical protein